MFDVAGKIVVVTGAASGIGRAICVAMAQAGASGVAALDLDMSGAEATVKLITDAGSKGLALRCDAGQESDIVAAVQRIETDFKAPVSCFVANAGITGSRVTGLPAMAVAAENASWEACWRVNVMQSVYAARLLIPAMLERGDGAFIVTSSAAGLLTFPNGEPATYITTKHAVRSWADSLRVRYQERGVSVHCICPKFVPSGMTAGLSDKFVSKMGGWVTAEEVAEELMRCINSGRYLVLSHTDTLEQTQQAWADFEGTMDTFAKANARLAASSSPRTRSKL